MQGVQLISEKATLRRDEGDCTLFAVNDSERNVGIRSHLIDELRNPKPRPLGSCNPKNLFSVHRP